MEKRYQVFISSTFRDLIDERQAVLKAVLELDHMPAGMELFPACDDSAWQLIKDVIDSSDYYVLIIGGRYGSLGEDGIGYTEKEYDYAVLQKKPVIPLLCKDPNALTREKTETDDATWQKLNTFRKKVEDKHTCVYWSSVDELKSKVIVGLTSTVKRHPATGWVRADRIPSGDHLQEILELRQKVSQLEKEKAVFGEHAPEGTEDLVQGNDLYTFNVRYNVHTSQFSFEGEIERGTYKLELSWNAIFTKIAPALINEVSDREFRHKFQSLLEQSAEAIVTKQPRYKKRIIKEVAVDEDQMNTCIIQLRALGLIRENRTKLNTVTWTLTPYGDNAMMKLIAIRRPS